MRRGMCTWGGGLLVAAVVVTVLGTAGPAWADGPVSISPSGPESVTGSTDTSTGRVLATFAITDTSMTATGATICRRWGDTARQGCEYRRFDGQPTYDEYGDEVYYEDDEYTRWDIVGGPGAWTVSYPIGFDGMTREQCLTAGWLKKPFAADIEVKNDAGVVLATSAWTYTVRCTGIEGGTTGPQRTQVYAGRSTTSKWLNFYVLDTRHLLRSYRICRYDWFNDRYYACDNEDLVTRNRTSDGWAVSWALTFRALGSTMCDYVDRKWPSAGFRVQFYDADRDWQLTLYRHTQLRC